MFNRTSLHIAMLVWGAIFSLIATLCMFMSKNFEKIRELLCYLFRQAVRSYCSVMHLPGDFVVIQVKSVTLACALATFLYL